MKTNRTPAMLQSSKLVLTGVAIATLGFISVANAQLKPAADDGITASPKVRQALNERRASVNPVAAPVSAMTCPKCAEVLTTQSKRQAKGAEVLVGVKSTEVKHTCAGCETQWTVVGEGKAKHSVATHKCSADVPNNKNCCAVN